jgi:hypothetical protein
MLRSQQQKVRVKAATNESNAWRAPCLRAPCQLRLLAGQERGRTIPLADIF